MLGLVHLDIDASFLGIDRNDVAVAHQGDGAALLCLRGDVPNDEAMRTTRETAVGDEGDVLSEIRHP